MHFEKITHKKIQKMCMWLVFFDRYGYLPFEKKRIDVSLSKANIIKLREMAKKQGTSVSEILDELVGLKK